MFVGGDFDDFMDEFEYAYENVPFYKKHLEKAGLSPSDILFESDIKNIPHTEKKDFRKNFPMGVFAQGYSLNDSTLVRSQSSGTTGDRLLTFEVGSLLLDRAVDCVEINPELKEAFTRSPRTICRYAAPNCSDVECANPNSTTEDRLLSDGTLVLPVYHDLYTTSDKLIKRALDEICSYQPDLYYVDPTHFAFLLRHAQKLNISLPKAPVVCTYTATTPLNRAQIKQAFSNFGAEDLVISELVSSSEMGWLAMECCSGHLHLNTKAYYMEIIKDQRDVELNEIGELYITSLDNGAIPHVRYKTGDLFRFLGDQCECGHPSPIVSMEGRLSDSDADSDSLSNDAYISPKMLSNAIGAHGWLDLYQLNQRTETSYEIQLLANDEYQTGDEQKVINSLNSVLGNSVDITHKIVSYIATERSGKFQCVKRL